MAISFITPTKEVKKISDFRSKIIIKPLMKGFGVTLGNALRRVLLSSIPGCSMFGIRVNNSNTIEFRAIPGLVEDCTQLILNLKKLVITSNLDDSEFENFKLENWPTLKINFSGKGVITGKDIECPSFFNVVNKDLIIANSENDYTKFVLEIFCTKGIGFRDFRKNIDIIGKTNTIVATDSDFSPVINVGYVVEEVKVSNIISTEQLILDVSTNGSITPEESINMACDILNKHLSILSENDNLVQNFNFTNKTNGNKKVAFTTIDDLELSANASKKIKDSAIHTIDQLINLSIEEINEIWKKSDKDKKEVIDALESRGLKFKNLN